MFYEEYIFYCDLTAIKIFKGLNLNKLRNLFPDEI